MNLTTAGTNDTSAQHCLGPDNDCIVSISSQAINKNSNHRFLDFNSKTDFTIVSTMIIISSIFNSLMLFRLYKKKRLRRVHYLLGNLSFCTIFMCYFMLGNIFVSKFFLSLFTLPTDWLCGIMNFGKYFPGALISLSSFGISYERVRSLSISRSKETKSAVQLLLFIWIVAGILSLPAAFTSVNKHFSKEISFSSSTSCKRIALFHSKFLDIMFEITKFFFMHITFSVCLLYELHLIRSKFKYLCVWSIPGTRLKKKIYRVRFAFVYSIILILFWISGGVAHLLYKHSFWFPVIKNQDYRKISSERTLNFLRLNLLLFLVVNPLVVFISNEDLTIFRSLFCRIRSDKEKDEGDSNNSISKKTKLQSEITESDMSRFATINHPGTSTAQLDTKDDVIIKIEENESIKINPKAFETTVTIEVETINHDK